VDTLNAGINARFAAVDFRFAELRNDMNTRFAELHADVRDLRTMMVEVLRSRTS
jgi:hypothetical protein